MTRSADSNPLIAANLAEVKAQIVLAGVKAGRSSTDITLVAVGKGHPAERSWAALAAGHRTFGENRVQEAEAKWPTLKAEFSDVRLHLIGPLQRNKVRQACGLFDVIETVDRLSLARALADEFAHTGNAIDCMIEVNTGEEPQKSGILPLEADVFIRKCRDEIKLPVIGLMCIPPVGDVAALHFALLRQIAVRNGLRELSMGMSADFASAIRFGATHVRVGTAIFGERLVKTT